MHNELFDITEEAAFHIITDQFPELTISSIKRVWEGGNHFTFEINENLIFKFPRDKDISVRLRKEIGVLRLIRSSLPIKVPHFEYVGKPSGLFPYAFSGQHKFTGISGEIRKPGISEQQTISKTVGDFLSVLHAVPLQQVESFSLPNQTLDHPAHTLSKLHIFNDVLKPAVGTNEKMNAYLSGNVRLPSESRLPLVLSHADIKGEHILVNESGTHIDAIIDWTDISCADPVCDFGGFVIWLGTQFVQQILKHYDLPTDNDFLYRVLFYTRCGTLFNLGERLAGASDAPLELLLAQLDRAFS